MFAVAFFLCTALRADAREDVTPVEKVVQMIRDLQTQVRPQPKHPIQLEES